MMKKISFLITLLTFSFILHAQQTGSGITAADAKNYIGKTVLVCDLIHEAILPNISKDEPQVLYTGSSFENRTLALVFTKNVLAKFSYRPALKMVNQKFCAKGKISTYKGKPAIYIKSESQITSVGE